MAISLDVIRTIREGNDLFESILEQRIATRREIINCISILVSQGYIGFDGVEVNGKYTHKYYVRSDGRGQRVHTN